MAVRRRADARGHVRVRRPAKLCGYELLKEGMDGVDLVVCNYHHLLDPNIREQFFHWFEREPEDVIAVFDEAHNVESAARDHARRALTENTLEQALDELDNEEDARTDAAANVIETFRDALVEAYEDSFGFGGREAVDEHWDDITIANDDRKDDLTLAFLRGHRPRLPRGTGPRTGTRPRPRREYEEAYKDGEATTRQECQTLQAAAFIDTWMGRRKWPVPRRRVRRDDVDRRRVRPRDTPYLRRR